MNDNEYQAWAEMGLREEHEEWLADPVAQAEYQQYLDQLRREHEPDRDQYPEHF